MHNIILLLYCIGELPVTIDFSPFDHDPGFHNITIVANSTLGEMADSTNTFLVPGALRINIIMNVLL